MILEKKLAVVTTKALRERLFGRFEGTKMADIRKILGEFILISKEKQKQLKLYDVENDERLTDRFIRFIREVAVAYQGKNILVVTHGGLIRAFLNHVGYKMPKPSEKIMKNAGYLILESDGVEFFIKEDKMF